ncbi:MAG: hypothetical protein P9L92_05970 [Candidatus Electryonea clarkiae]|nr:hypothetical protein [Candidatus Electryonea clarkiae]MDP8288787.1 hypothetical protein [Candidatus Electryonea clarkiae]
MKLFRYFLVILLLAGCHAGQEEEKPKQLYKIWNYNGYNFVTYDNYEYFWKADIYKNDGTIMTNALFRFTEIGSNASHNIKPDNSIKVESHGYSTMVKNIEKIYNIKSFSYLTESEKSLLDSEPANIKENYRLKQRLKYKRGYEIKLQMKNGDIVEKFEIFDMSIVYEKGGMLVLQYFQPDTEMDAISIDYIELKLL